MVSLLKKALSLVGVLLVVCLVLNLNIGGRPARDRALEIWQSEGVQKVYRVVRDRLMAVIRKDISVEDVLKPTLPAKDSTVAPKQSEAPSVPAKSAATAKAPDSEDTRVIRMEKLDDQDRKALEKILEKSSK